MKKQFIYAGMFLFTIGFSACNEDFKDWAAPPSPIPKRIVQNK
mgnify:CR=1 FL=1